MTQRSLAKRISFSVALVVVRFMAITLFHVRCRGRGRWPTTGGAIVCSNHQSYFDPVLVGLSCDRPLNYVARRTLFRFAPFRWLINWYGAIPIEREGLGIGGLKEMLRRLKRGELVLMFPEGTRTRDGEVGSLHPGICAVARRAKVPIVPVGLDGAYQSWPRHEPRPKLETIHLQIGDPIQPAEVRALGDDGLIAELRGRMVACQATARGSRRRSLGCGR